MESQTARKVEDAKKEEAKTSEEKIKKMLQEILDGMNGYIRKHSDYVKSPTSERLLSIKKIALAIYRYYPHNKDVKAADESAKKGDLPEELIKTFDSNLGDMFNFLDDAARHGKPLDTSHLKLLPELKEFYKSEVLPCSLHGFHAIIGLIQTEIKLMPSWRGRSELRDALVTAISGYDTISQELGTNVYIAGYSGEVSFAEMLKRPTAFANYLYEALTTSRIYQEGYRTVTFSGANKSFFVTFCSSKEAALTVIKEHKLEEAACFGAEFSFTLRKTPPDEIGQYIPLLSSVQQMDIWETTKSHSRSNAYGVECHSTKPAFVLTDKPSLAPGKKQ